MHPMRYITRLKNRKGWIVKINQGTPNEKMKNFSDRHYGGTEKALMAAKIWRDRRMEEKDTTFSSSRLRKQSIVNRSGYIGISKEKKEFPHSVYEGWRATYYVDTRQIHESFSSALYGECEAFRKACRARFEHAGELRQVIENPDVPCEPDVPVIEWFEKKIKGDL